MKNFCRLFYNYFDIYFYNKQTNKQFEFTKKKEKKINIIIYKNIFTILLISKKYI